MIFLHIKDIPIKERPRERLIELGSKNLSNEELLSIILRCGTKNKSAKELSLEILKELKNIENLKDITINKLLSINGIGLSKATLLIAVIELGKRIFLSKKQDDKTSYTNPNVIYENTKYLFDNKKQEYFYCLYFNNKQQLIGQELLFMGTVNKSLVHPREVFKYAYLYSASSIICLHNHPSGDVTPSLEDIKLTNALVEIGCLQNIPVLDHIIIGDNNYYSFRDNGKINNR